MIHEVCSLPFSFVICFTRSFLLHRVYLTRRGFEHRQSFPKYLLHNLDLKHPTSVSSPGNISNHSGMGAVALFLFSLQKFVDFTNGHVRLLKLSENKMNLKKIEFSKSLVVVQFSVSNSFLTFY